MCSDSDLIRWSGDMAPLYQVKTVCFKALPAFEVPTSEGNRSLEYKKERFNKGERGLPPWYGTGSSFR